MLRLRPYKNIDAETIVTWCKDEETFRKWTGDRYESYPITAEDMNRKYVDFNGDCEEPDNFFPMTAYDENGIVGHMILRFRNEEKTVLRFGFVIVDDAKRGKGYGKEMLQLALKYAFELMKVERVTLGAFANNIPAYYCYKAVGFQDVAMEKPIVLNICGQQWSILELTMDKKDYETSRQ